MTMSRLFCDLSTFNFKSWLVATSTNRLNVVGSALPKSSSTMPVTPEFRLRFFETLPFPWL
jgi:hypothetical protein